MELREQLNLEKIPRHVAVIMDGNGRWAKHRGKERIFGHENGVEAVRQTVNAAAEIGVEYLTFFAFSTENWQRPKLEVNALMRLLVKAIQDETPELHEKGVRLLAIGNLESLPDYCQHALKSAIELTADNKRLTVVVALSYSSRWEILNAVKKIAELVHKGEIAPEDIDNRLLENNLLTAGIPDPDLLIRTSGEQRISNFLIWQLAYSELIFPCVLWPDFRKEHFFQAILDYQKRERRFGKVPKHEFC
ncbi:MAG TPA: isoprenyl transferase [Bacteroidales bacterium]|nr:isoprenyl transferase [Bacteroidales bacterium]